MKNITLCMLLLLVLTGNICYAQKNDSLKVIKTNEVGLEDSTRSLIKRKADFKHGTYIKGRIIVKFKSDQLNFNNLKVNINAAEFKQSFNKKAQDTLDRFENMLNDIQGMKPLTKLANKGTESLKGDTKNTVEDIYNIMIVYCKEGQEETVASSLLKTGLVIYAEPDYTISINDEVLPKAIIKKKGSMKKRRLLPNDPMYFYQSALEQYDDRDIDAETAWDTKPVVKM